MKHQRQAGFRDEPGGVHAAGRGRGDLGTPRAARGETPRGIPGRAHLQRIPPRASGAERGGGKRGTASPARPPCASRTAICPGPPGTLRGLALGDPAVAQGKSRRGFYPQPAHFLVEASFLECS